MEGRWSLTAEMVGENVALLHWHLSIIGIEIEEGERAAKRFGQSTRAGVMRLQAIFGIPVTGDVDDATLGLLRGALERLRPGDDRPPSVTPGGDDTNEPNT